MSTKAPEVIINDAENEVQPSTNKSPLQNSTDSTNEICQKINKSNNKESPQGPDSRLLGSSASAEKSPRDLKTVQKPKPIPQKMRSCTRTIGKRESATNAQKVVSSGIPLRLNQSPNAPPTKVITGKTTYRPQSHTSNMPFMNKNTLEVQFMNNKKRLMQLHAELVEKQRPMLDIHKSLQRTKKQLEEMGKKVVLEDIKIVSIKSEDTADDTSSGKIEVNLGGGETIIPDEATMELKASIDNVIGSCVEACQKCFLRSNDVVRMLEGVSNSEIEVEDIGAEVEELKKQKQELEDVLEATIEENEKKIEELMNLWQKALKGRSGSEQMTKKIAELEEKMQKQQKIISDAEDNVVSLNRRFEEKKTTYEKQINELQEKVGKLEEEVKKEKKNANDNLMKSRTLRGKVTELETRAKESEEKLQDATTKLKQIQEQMRKKEIQWLKEKDDFKKNEALLQQKFMEKQSHFDTRLKEMEETQKTSEKQQENFFRTMETQLEIKEQELTMMEKDRDLLSDRSKTMEEQIVILSKQIEDKDKEIEELSIRGEQTPAIEYRPETSSQIEEILSYKKLLGEAQESIKQQSEQITKMQSSLKAHAQLAVALKLEKDNAIKYSNKLRDILQEARDEIDYKNKTIYKVHEKLVLKEAACDKLKGELKDLEAMSEVSGRFSRNNRCQICMSSITGNDFGEPTDVSNNTNNSNRSNSPGQYVSKSLIGMSVRKVDNLRNRLDNLKKMTLAPANTKQFLSKLNAWASQQSGAKNTDLKRQIALRGKLYTILQKHADQSCEDFINLLKLTASNSGRGSQAGFAELKPSNIDVNFETAEFTHQVSNNVQMTKSFSAFSQLYDKKGMFRGDAALFDLGGDGGFEDADFGSVLIEDDDDYEY